MTTTINRACRTGLVAAGLTATAGMSELISGSNSLTGDKSEPTALGVLTVILAVIMAVSALLIRRAPTNAPSMASASGMTISALLTLTTAGLLAIPGVMVGVAAGVIAVADARTRGSIPHTISQAWPATLIGILAAIDLAFGAARNCDSHRWRRPVRHCSVVECRDPAHRAPSHRHRASTIPRSSPLRDAQSTPPPEPSLSNSLGGRSLW